MSLDAVCLKAVVEELRPKLLGRRIDRVQQPSRDQIVLLLRGDRLLLNAGAGAPRIQLTEQLRENPAEPPMFCMLLRKHLTGAKIADLTQPPLERLVRMELDVLDEFGRAGKRSLILEAMGRRSNLILLDEEERVIDCLRRVDWEMSAARQVLPGLYYEAPDSSDRLPVLEETEEGFRNRLAAAPEECHADAFLLDQYFGLSPLMARELTFRASGETDCCLVQMSEGEKKAFWSAFSWYCDAIKGNHFTPISLVRQGKPLEVSALPIMQYGDAVESIPYESFSSLLDAFYETRERQERMRQRGADLLKTVTTARNRLKRKLAMQKKDYAKTQERDHLRICGDLITSNLYRMQEGSARLVCENFYEEGSPSVEIQLDPRLTPQENAAKYYKRYTKAKTAERYLGEQMEIAQRDLQYLESVLEEIAEAETEQDFLDIRNELRDAGFLRKQGGKGKKERNRASKPREFRTSTGFRVLVGRNNRQNDKLTMKEADHRDLWFHTQKIHGSHVILCTEGKQADETSLVEAAQLAAYYSQARESGNVPVDYALVKHVKKPNGARPGMVIYTTYQTVNVTPDEALVKRLSVK